MRTALPILFAAFTTVAACSRPPDHDHDNDPGTVIDAGTFYDLGPPSPPLPYPGQEGPPSSIDGVPIPPECQSTGFPGADQHVNFNQLRATLVAQKPALEATQAALLAFRYDLSDMPSASVTMFRGKPVQVGIRVKLPPGTTWASLGSMSPDEIRAAKLFPPGFLALPHPHHAAGGMVIEPQLINELRLQTLGFRDLLRFDIDFDLPQIFLPEFPPAMFLTTHPDLGDVSQGQLVNIENYYEMFKFIMTPKQLEGLRMLVVPTPEQEFNLIDDRRTDRPSLGIACFDCHTNGHTDGSILIMSDNRPQPQRRRGDTPSLRGVANQQIFGSKRAFMTVEDFTVFEERTAYFDDDLSQPLKKGFSLIDPTFQLVGMAEVQRILNFPPAPKLDLLGRLDTRLASAAEIRGEQLFHGKAQCAGCHPPPYYIDNVLHDLHLERFYDPQLVNCALATAEGPVKTTTLRGIKESPPYFHDGRLLTLEDSIEFFNIVLSAQLTAGEKSDLLAFLYTL
jgi:cytochrome c peroxidase